MDEQQLQKHADEMRMLAEAIEQQDKLIATKKDELKELKEIREDLVYQLKSTALGRTEPELPFDGEQE